MRRCLFITALPEEFDAVIAHLAKRRIEYGLDGSAAEIGTIHLGSTDLEAVVVEVGMGNERAAAATVRALYRFAPDIAMLVGVAGGLKDVALGDVVVGTKVYGYERGRDANTFAPRPEVFNPTFRLTEAAKVVARRRRESGGDFRVLLAPIAAGSKVVADTRSATAQFLRTHYSDAAAVEMEGFGFLEATFSASDVIAGVVRGVMDLLSEKESA